MESDLLSCKNADHNQNVRIGCDIVHIPTFQQCVHQSQGKILEQLFTRHELAYSSEIHSRAGIFAAKESIIKAIGHLVPWHDIEITHQPSGKPTGNFCQPYNATIIDISIAHAGDYAIAYALIQTTVAS